MNTKASWTGISGSNPASSAGVLTALLAGATLLPLEFACAQTAVKPGGAGTPPPVAAAGNPGAPTAAKANTPSDNPSQASRFVGPESLGTYVKSMAANFAMTGRKTDPFGQPQDPNAKPKEEPKKTPQGPTPQPSGPSFADVVRLIKVTTIMPGEKKFLVGTRSIREGQKFPINYRGVKIETLVVSISGKRIVLRNLATNETATLDLNARPSGMSPGGSGIATPGMTRNAQDSPLDLDLDSQPNQPPINQ